MTHPFLGVPKCTRNRDDVVTGFIDSFVYCTNIQRVVFDLMWFSNMVYIKHVTHLIHDLVKWLRNYDAQTQYGEMNVIHT